ncbi:MAG: GNAT family N-acetyltransferase [Caulobacteraceae bacterium]
MSDLKDRPELGRFEAVENGKIVFARYRRAPGQLIIDHVEAPPSLRGTGAADRLMGAILERAQAEGVEIVPLCGWAVHWLARRGTHRSGHSGRG